MLVLLSSEFGDVKDLNFSIGMKVVGQNKFFFKQNIIPRTFFLLPYSVAKFVGLIVVQSCDHGGEGGAWSSLSSTSLWHSPLPRSFQMFIITFRFNRLLNKKIILVLQNLNYII